MLICCVCRNVQQLSQAFVPASTSISAASRGQRSDCPSTAERSGGTCRGPAGCAGSAEQEAAALHDGEAAALVAGGGGVHARNDHASCAGGGDDGADCLPYGEPRVAKAGGAHQQLTVR